MKNQKGFTLVELLAVIVILAIILAISVPAITGMIDSSRKAAFKESSQMVIRAVMLKAGSDENFNYASITAENAEDTLEIDASVYKTLTVTKSGDNFFIIAEGDNDFSGYTAYGTKSNMTVSKTEEAVVVLPAPSTSTDDNCFTFDSVTKTITDYSLTCDKDVVIPNTIGGINVEVLGDGSFQNKGLTSIYIPSNIEAILGGAFYGNSISTIFIPGNVKMVDSGAFSGGLVPITSFIISEGVTSINSSMVSGLQLTSLVLPNSLTSIGAMSFSDVDIDTVIIRDNSISAIFYPLFSGSINHITFPGSLKTIGGGSFRDLGLTSVTFEEGVTTISSGAFGDNNLSSLTFPSSVKTITGSAFGHNKLTEITIPSTVTEVGNAFDNNLMSTDKAFIYGRNSDGTINTNKLVSYAGAVRDNITIPSNVTSIGDYTFSMSSITSISIPSTVTSIGKGALSNNSLSSIALPSSLISIGEEAFRDNQLTSISIPASVTSIGDRALMVNQLTSIIMGGSSTTLGASAVLYGDDSFQTAYAAGGAGTYIGTQEGTTWTKQ